MLSDGSVAALYSDTSESAVSGDFYDVNLETFNQILSLELADTGKDKVLEAIKVLEQRADVLYARPNYIYSFETDTSTDEYELPTYLATNSLRSVTTNDAYANDQWAIEMINLSSAWQITTGTSRKVTVAIIDTGIDAGHPDLIGKVSTSKSRCIDMDGNASTVSTVTDTNGHGTMAAGIIGAITNNSIGISGVNWNVELVSLSTIGASESIAKALDIAEEKKIPIVNLSQGVVGPEDVLYESAENYSGLLVCAAGNLDNADDEMLPQYPAFYNLPNTITVGASTMFDSPWHLSYYGSNVNLFAPGATIYSTMTTSLCTLDGCTATGYHDTRGYHAASGTSYAAPYVAGVASLLLSLDDDLNNIQLKYHIINGVDISSAYQGKCQTGGRLNAYKVLSGHVCYYADDGASGHYRYCVCGLNVFEDHTFTDIGGLLVCSDCGFAW